jgi:hypothetical protein
MRTRVSAYVSADVATRLQAAVNRQKTTKTAIIEAALARYLNPEGDTNDQVALLWRLNWMSRQLEQLDRDLRIVSETAALHARYHLAVTPPLSPAEQRSACRLGAERFEVLAAQVGRRVHLGVPLMRETMDRLAVMSPELFADEREVVDVSRTSEAHYGPPGHGTNDVNASSQVFAAAGEDGSNGSFQRGGSQSFAFSGQRPRYGRG